MPIVTNDTLETVFHYHRPTKEQALRYVALRAKAKHVAYCLLNPPADGNPSRPWAEFSQDIADQCPGGHERAVALNNISDGLRATNHQKKMICLRQALMWANAAIACNEPDADAEEAATA